MANIPEQQEVEKEQHLEPIDMPSVEQNAARREEYYRYSRNMLQTYPNDLMRGVSLHDALLALEKLKHTMDREGHVDHWIYHDKYVCRIQRNTVGSWCGYVGVPPGHPVHGMDYNSVELEVHGGLTFSELVHNWGKDRFWFLGFDCGHAFDVSFVNIIMPMQYEEMTYKDREFATAETNNLARQLEEIEEMEKEKGK